MTTKKRSPQAQRSSDGQQQRALTITADAERRIRERNEAGQFLAKVTDEQWADVIERVRGGDTDANLCRELGVSGGTIALKRRQDPAFAQAYYEALEDAFVSIAQETLAISDGVDANPTGDVQRDRLRVETRLKLASKFARKILGDQPLIDARSVTIIARTDGDDIC